MSIPEDSILNSVKKLVGISSDYTEFDEEIKIHINNAMVTLFQLGVPVDFNAFVSDASSSYSSVFGDTILLGAIKAYIPMKVRLAFDPPSATNVSNALNDNVAETEWRIAMQVSCSVLNGGEDGV